MRCLFTLILSFITIVACAQDRNIFYFKNGGKRVLFADSSDYVRVISKPESGSKLFDVLDIYKNGKKRLMGYSLTIKDYIPEGLTVIYHENGNKKSILNYSNGKLSGECYEYFQNGKLRIAKQYYNSKPKKGSNKDANEYNIIALNDSTGKVLISSGNGYYSGYVEKPLFSNTFINIKEEGNIKDGKRNGTWKGSDEAGKMSFTEIYQNGFLVSGISTDSAGGTHHYSSKRFISAKYNDKEAIDFVLATHRKVKSSASASFIHVSDKVFIKFQVNKNGSLKDLSMQGGFVDWYNEDMLYQLRKAKIWAPALYFGIPVNFDFNIALSYGSNMF